MQLEGSEFPEKGIGFTSSAMDVQSPNHWTTRNSPSLNVTEKRP